jgi:hypothetical protein
MAEGLVPVSGKVVLRKLKKLVSSWSRPKAVRII